MIKIKKIDLYNIYEAALFQFKSSSNNKLDSKEFMAKCYTDSVIKFLESNNINLKIEFEHESMYSLDSSIDD